MCARRVFGFKKKRKNKRGCEKAKPNTISKLFVYEVIQPQAIIVCFDGLVPIVNIVTLSNVDDLVSSTCSHK